MGMIADADAIPSLLVALRNTVTRAEAAASLAKFGPSVIPSLLSMLSAERDENIRYHVRETLTAVGWRRDGCEPAGELWCEGRRVMGDA